MDKNQDVVDVFTDPLKFLVPHNGKPRQPWDRVKLSKQERRGKSPAQIQQLRQAKYQFLKTLEVLNRLDADQQLQLLEIRRDLQASITGGQKG